MILKLAIGFVMRRRRLFIAATRGGLLLSRNSTTAAFRGGRASSARVEVKTRRMRRMVMMLRRRRAHHLLRGDYIGREVDELDDGYLNSHPDVVYERDANAGLVESEEVVREAAAAAELAKNHFGLVAARLVEAWHAVVVFVLF